MKSVTNNILIFAICLLLHTFVAAQDNAGENAPAIVLKDLKGKTVRLSDFKDKVIVLNFWATWCPPCRAEIPELVKWQREYKGRGLQIIGITVPPANLSKVNNFVSKNKINYPILIGAKKTKALFTADETMPFTVIIDKKGKIVGVIKGLVFQDEFDEKIMPLIDPPVKTRA